MIKFEKNEKKLRVLDKNDFVEEKIGAIKNYLFKMFDTHFLNFIAHRKIRDYAMVNEAIKLIVESGNFSKDVINDNKLSDFFVLEKNRLSILNDILPVNHKEQVLNIEREIEILKTIMKFYNDFSKQYLHNEIDIHILSKMSKVKELTDEKILNRISSSEVFCKKVMSNIPSLKSFDKIGDSKIFYNLLEQEKNFLFAEK